MKRERILACLVLVPILLITLSCSQTTPTSKTQKSIDHDQWVANVLKEIQTIKVGMTREQLLKVFTVEGGLSTPIQRTYIHRDCPYIKVDVRFKKINEDIRGENPHDVITKISRSYLQWSTMD